MAVENSMTAEFLHSAFGGESMAHMRYTHWADAADKEGFPNVGRLFRAIAFAESVHAGNHFREIGGDSPSDESVTAGGVFCYGTTVENLQGGINGELHEVKQMYPVYLNAAEFQDEKGAQRSFHYALEAEKIHAKLFQDALDCVKQGKDIALKKIYICPVCGYTVVDDAPDKCPICGCKSEKFVEF